MDENTTIEITQEERERIIRELKNPENDSKDLCEISFILDNNRENCDDITCRECSKIAREKILALIESAPAKKNMRAAKLADKLESETGKNHSLLWMIENTLNMDHNSSYEGVARKLCNVLRNIDAPDDEREQEIIKCLPLPTDKNGDPVDVGDVCFKETGERVVINRIYYYGGNNIFAFDTQDKKIKPSEIIKAKEPRNFYALKNELTHAVHYDTNLLTSLFKDIAAYMLPEIQGAEDEETSEV